MHVLGVAVAALAWNPKVMKKLQNKVETAGEKSSMSTKEDMNKMCLTTSRTLSCKANKFMEQLFRFPMT